MQRCVLESLRLAPISPIAARWATADTILVDGTQIKAGDRVHIDMRALNRDPTVFGLVGVVIQELIGLGVRPDPDDLPELDLMTDRGTYSRYPVVLTNPGGKT